MADPQDAVLPILVKIQKDIADFRKASEAKANDMAENILQLKDDVSEIKRDLLMGLGLTVKQGADLADVRTELADVKKRLAALEARS